MEIRIVTFVILTFSFCCSVFSLSAEINPPEYCYREYDDITISCSFKGMPVDLTNASLVFKSRNSFKISNLPFKIISSDTIQTVLSNVTRFDDDGTVFCGMAGNAVDMTQHSIYIEKKIELPRQIYCFYDHSVEKIICQWTGSKCTCWDLLIGKASGNPSESDAQTKCSLSNTSTTLSPIQNCIQSCVDKDVTFIASCPWPYMEGNSDLSAAFRLKGQKVSSSASKIFYQYFGCFQEKLEIGNSSVINTTLNSAVVKWNIIQRTTDDCDCEIQCDVKISFTAKTHLVKKSCLSSINTTFVQKLEKLPVNKTHYITIKCQIIGSTVWSSGITVNLTTLHQVPKPVPGVKVVGYDLFTCGINKTCLFLHWMDKDKDFDGYRVLISADKSGFRLDRRVSSAPTGKIEFSTVDHFASFNVTVWGMCSNRTSENSTSLEVYDNQAFYNGILPVISCVAYKKHNTGISKRFNVLYNTENGMIMPAETIKTLYWCQGTVFMSHVLCKATMRYSRVTSENNSFTVDTENTTDSYTWYIGMSAILNGKMSSVIWLNCNNTSLQSSAKGDEQSDLHLVVIVIIAILPVVILGVMAIILNKTSLGMKAKRVISRFICMFGQDRIGFSLGDSIQYKKEESVMVVARHTGEKEVWTVTDSDILLCSRYAVKRNSLPKDNTDFNNKTASVSQHSTNPKELLLSLPNNYCHNLPKCDMEPASPSSICHSDVHRTFTNSTSGYQSCNDSNTERKMPVSSESPSETECKVVSGTIFSDSKSKTELIEETECKQILASMTNNVDDTNFFSYVTASVGEIIKKTEFDNVLDSENGSPTSSISDPDSDISQLYLAIRCNENNMSETCQNRSEPYSLELESNQMIRGAYLKSNFQTDFETDFSSNDSKDCVFAETEYQTDSMHSINSVNKKDPYSPEYKPQENVDRTDLTSTNTSSNAQQNCLNVSSDSCSKCAFDSEFIESHKNSYGYVESLPVKDRTISSDPGINLSASQLSNSTISYHQARAPEECHDGSITGYVQGGIADIPEDFINSRGGIVKFIIPKGPSWEPFSNEQHHVKEGKKSKGKTTDNFNTFSYISLEQIN